MTDLKEYKCPSCDGAINFDSSLQKMKCPYCNTEFEIEAFISFNKAEAEGKGENINWDKMPFEQLAENNIGVDDASSLVNYVCNSCAGEIITTLVEGSFTCPYCGNQIVSKKVFSGMNKPDCVIPFKLDKKTAKDTLLRHLKGKMLLPKVFSDENKIESIQGIYVPFWLFNAEADANIRFKATKRYKKGNATHTEHYMLVRGGHITFQKIPADASKRLDDALMESIEPFDLTEGVPFQGAYLAGYGAEKYDVNISENRERINKRIKNSVIESFKKTLNGYNSSHVENINITFTHSNVYYALLPVWIVSTKYKEKIYTFAMNGQTGKFVGNLPVDYGIYWKNFAITFAIITVLGFLINMSS